MAKSKAKVINNKSGLFSGKNIATSVIGGALLLYAYKNRSTKMGKLASVAGTSLLGRTFGGFGLV